MKTPNKSKSVARGSLRGRVRAQLRELASKESDVAAELVNNKAAELPLSHKSRAWNMAFQQGIYEGVRRCEDLLYEKV